MRLRLRLNHGLGLPRSLANDDRRRVVGPTPADPDAVRARLRRRLQRRRRGRNLDRRNRHRRLRLAADRRFVSCERLVDTGDFLAEGPIQSLRLNRLMVDGVVEAPGGAHFTLCAPDYGRDEKFQRHYASAAAEESTWQEFVETYLSGTEADYQAAVRRFAEQQEAK